MTTYTHALPAAPVDIKWANNLLQIMSASLFIALCAQISVPLYFTPVPLSGQVFAVMLIGAVLGSHKGVLAVLAYIVEGAMGLPVFAAGSYGMLSLLGPTGGYFLGFIVQAYLAGTLAKKTSEFTSLKTLGVLMSSCAVQLACGSLYLSFYAHLDMRTAFMAGFLPFILGEALKSLAVTTYLKSAFLKNAANSHL